jgi:hypothetical protein
LRIILTICVVAAIASFAPVESAVAQSQKAEAASRTAKADQPRQKAGAKAKSAKKSKSTEQYLRVAP